MKLWGSHLSPFLMRALFCARIKGIEIAVEAPPFDPHSSEFRSICPLGKVPVLVSGNLNLPESSAICEYIEESVPGQSIWPDGLVTRSRARVLCQIIDLYMFPEMCNTFLPDIAPGPIEGAKARLLHSMDAFEYYLEPNTEWLVCDRPTIADAFTIPTLLFFDTIGASLGALDWLAERPLLAAWWERTKLAPFARRGYDEQRAALEKAMSALAANVVPSL